jgi:hypothetical protein
VTVFGHAAKTRVVYLFHDGAELRWVQTKPRPGRRVRSSQGDHWITAEVLQSGADTYTVTCVAPREINGTRERAMAYLERDREFVLVTLFGSGWTLFALSGFMAIWVSFVLVAIIVTFLIIAWATK